MVVLGVDPGSLNTGYGVISQSSGVLSVLVCGVIRLNPRRTHAERIGEIYIVSLKRLLMILSRNV